MEAERRMPPEQARLAKMARESEERAQMMEDFTSKVRRDRERSEKREGEAVASVRLPAAVVAEKALSYLAKVGSVDVERGLQGAVEHLLVGMVRGERLATEGTCKILEKWKGWAERGGMTKDDLALLRSELVGFCFASCVVGLMTEVGGKDETGLAADMRENLRTWRKVRLG